MAQKIEFFVSEDRKVRGPVRLEELRREFESGANAEKNVLFRMEGCKRFLPGNAWDPLSDLFDAPSALDRPDGAVAEKPPRDLATLEPEARDKLLWFVEDADGVMGPVTGAFVARGLMTGRIPITAAVALVSVPGWIRATALFPAALEGATEIRMRPLGSYACPYCLEPVIIGSTNCLMCNENVAMGEPGLSMKQVAALVGGALAVIIVPLIIGALSARSSARSQQPVEPPPAETASSVATESSAAPNSGVRVAGSSPGADASAAPKTDAPVSAPDKPVLQGEVISQFTVPPDVEDAFVLARGHVVITRRSGLDVIEPKSGAMVTTSREVVGARKLVSMQGALYSIGASRIGVLDADSLRLSKWIDLKGPFLPGSVSREVAVFPSVIDRSVIVVGSSYHVELGRFRFPNDLPGLVAVEKDGSWAAAAVGDPRLRIDAIATFSPRISPSAQIFRRTAMGDAVVALAAGNGHAYAALAGGRIAAVPFQAPDVPAKPTLSAETCKEPAFVLTSATTIAVGCRGGQAVALHALGSLEQDARIEVGAPVVAMDLAATSNQLLVATGNPAPGLFVVDLPSGATRRVSVTEEVTSVAFGEIPQRATAYSARSHRVWVLE